MIIEIAGSIALPMVGWLVNKQLEINRKALDTATRVETLVPVVSRIEERTDAIYAHLLARSGPDPRRGHKG